MGFIPVGYKDGKEYKGAARRYYKSAAVAIGIGDPVVRAANSADPEGGPAVTRATTGAAITGVVVGVQMDPTRPDQSGYLKSGDTGYLLVADEPDLMFEVQEGGSGTNLAVTNIGEAIDSVTAIDCNQSTGMSKYEIDKGALASGNTWILMELVRRQDNAIGNYAKWLVCANLHTEQNAGAANISEI